MQPAASCELVPVANAIFLWQKYDPAIKAELFSTALVTANQTVVIVDPTQLPKAQLDLLLNQRPLSAIVITNSNHHRDALWYSKQLSAPIFAHRCTFSDQEPAPVISVAQDDRVVEELKVIEIDGAALGEIALYHSSNGGTLIIGDALINFAPYGFAFLPRKYCTNQKQLRRSLRKLLDYDAERIFFAHGAPILSRATARLRQLLEVDH
jgi:glyoxylase-like metal-dependent hydrolase (beta-lactamase superfamily II)